MPQCNFQIVSCYMSYMWENFEKMFTLKFDMNKYSLLQNKIQEMPNQREWTITYAIAATYNSNQNVHVCCNRDVHKDICKMYNKVDYDFTSFVVSWCLGHV